VWPRWTGKPQRAKFRGRDRTYSRDTIVANQQASLVMSEIAYRLRMSAIVQLLCLVLLCVGGAAPALAEARLALVIGNAAYKVGALANPRNDAALMADSLRAVGFEVTTLSDATKDQMKQALLAFSRKLRETGAVGLFYYAGHGVQLRGENYVVPIDADIQNEAEVEFLALNVNEFLSAMERTSNQINIVILDACRNNPFARSFRSAARGLATVDAPRGSYIAYATAPGQVALDGDKGNSPYASALAGAIRTPGLTIEDTFKKARREVLAATADQQIPWDTSSITGSFYFAGAAPAPAVTIAAPPRTDAPAIQAPQAVPSPPAKVATAPEQPAAPAAMRRLSLQPQIQPVGKWPEGLAFNGKSLWVADSGQRAIRQITPGGAGRSVTVGRLPVGMVAAPDGRILVAVQTDKLIWAQSGETGKPLTRLKECIEQIELAQRDLLVVTQPDCSSASSKLVAIDIGSGKARSSGLLGSDASDVVAVNGRALVAHATGAIDVIALDTLAVAQVVQTGNTLWRGAAGRSGVFFGGMTQRPGGRAMVMRLDPASLKVTHRREFDSPEMIVAIAATEDRLIAADRLGRIWIMRGNDLSLETEIQSGAGPFTPQAMIVVGDTLLVTTHKGQGENGSIYAFNGWRAAVAGKK